MCQRQGLVFQSEKPHKCQPPIPQQIINTKSSKWQSSMKPVVDFFSQSERSHMCVIVDLQAYGLPREKIKFTC